MGSNLPELSAFQFTVSTCRNLNILRPRAAGAHGHARGLAVDLVGLPPTRNLLGRQPPKPVTKLHFLVRERGVKRPFPFPATAKLLYDQFENF